MNRIKVLFLAEELRVGGAETYFYSLENNIDRTIIDFYSMAVDGKCRNKISHIEKFYAYSFSFINRIKRINKVCRDSHIDIIHVNSLRLAFAASAIKRKRDIKIIYTKHNITALEKISVKLYSAFLNKNIDIVNVICETEKDYLERIGVDNKRLKVVYNGIQISDFPLYYPRRVKKIVNIGILARVDKVKNHELFLNIAWRIHKDFDYIHFYIGGDGPNKKNIENIINKKCMNHYVHLLGYVKASEFLAKMDYTMLVSKREVFPMSIIEAMASGTIVISKNIGGISELIDEQTGYLISGDNVDDYVQAIKDSLAQDECKKIIAARKKVEEHFTIQKMISDIQELYLQLGHSKINSFR